ncbi:MAG: galactose-1-phosphate uridylyltransferase [Firmicutes bacterium]|nr:galactose-1-phosphate uridylyltransferase [Bacillota bacterium]
MISELRRDPTSGAWVAIASARSRRPSDFRIIHGEQKTGTCPFCYGSEHMTPPEVFALGRAIEAPNAEGWQVRVVPNKFPAFSLEYEGSPDMDSDSEAEDGLYVNIPAVGIHEVVVESPEHDSTFGTHSQDRMEDILTAIIARFRALRENKRLKYLQAFKNWGRQGGASLSHTHCQLIAVPIVPKVIEVELDYARQHKDRTGKCLYCQTVEKEIDGKERVLAESEHFLAFCPYASKFPYETWITPKRHNEAFEEISQDELADLATMLRQVVRTFELAFDDVPYNIVWHTAPWKGDFGAYYHWHLELIPRLATIAGFELGTGYYINPTAPEVAAAALRESMPGRAEG